MGFRKDLVGGGLLQSAGGLEGIRILRKLKERWRGDSRVLGDGDFVTEVLKETEEADGQKTKLKHQFDLESLGKKVSLELGLAEGVLFSGRRFRSLSLGKGVFSYLAADLLGYSLVEIGKKLKISGVSVYQIKDKGRDYIANKGNFLIT